MARQYLNKKGIASLTLAIDKGREERFNRRDAEDAEGDF